MTQAEFFRAWVAEGARHIAVSGEMTVYTAAECHKRLLELLPLTVETRVDLSGVTEMDTAGMQLVAGLQREAAVRGVAFAITAHSPATRELLGLFRFEGENNSGAASA